MSLFALAKSDYLCVLVYNSPIYVMALLEDTSEKKTVYTCYIFIGCSRYSTIWLNPSSVIT